MLPARHSETFSFDDEQFSLLIQGSKTDQYHRGATIQITRNSQTQPLFKHIHNFCPLGLKFKAPFFCHLNAMPFTKYQFSALLHKPVKFIGLYTTIFKSHSFGIGGATRLYLQGSSDEDIKSKGRWKFVHSILMVYAYDCNIIVL